MRTKKTKSTKKQNKKTKQNKNKRTKKQNKKVISDNRISPDANISCADCNKTAIRTNMLVPLECLQKHGETAHRLCQRCWWSKFAIEGASHECPGCKKGKPLNPPIKEDIIVISDSD